MFLCWELGQLWARGSGGGFFYTEKCPTHAFLVGPCSLPWLAWTAWFHHSGKLWIGWPMPGLAGQSVIAQWFRNCVKLGSGWPLPGQPGQDDPCQGCLGRDVVAPYGGRCSNWFVCCTTLWKVLIWYDSSKVANFAITFCNYFTSTMDVRHIRGMKRKLMTEVLWIQFFNGLLLIIRVEWMTLKVVPGSVPLLSWLALKSSSLKPLLICQVNCPPNSPKKLWMKSTD